MNALLAPGGTPSGRARQARGDSAREALLAAAEGVFARTGFSGATTGAGAGAGLGTGTGAGVSGRMPLITGSCWALAFSRRVMPTSSSASSTIV